MVVGAVLACVLAIEPAEPERVVAIGRLHNYVGLMAGVSAQRRVVGAGAAG